VTVIRYEMFSEAGEAACARMVDEIIEEIRLGKLRRPQLENRINRGCNQVEKEHGEVWDTEPQYEIAAVISMECEKQGWKPVSRWDW
jgi:hypothetical protein